MTQNLELSFVDTSLMNQDNVSDPTFFDQQVERAMKNKELDKDGTTRFVLRNLNTRTLLAGLLKMLFLADRALKRMKKLS